MDRTRDRVELVEGLAREGGRLALESFRSTLTVGTKDGPLDRVTAVDRAVQERVFDGIREVYPGDVLVGEEGDARETLPDSGVAWVVDPIDGTNNYVAGNRRWATSLALAVDGDPVAAVNHLPALGDTYVATGGKMTRNGTAVTVSSVADPSSLTVAPVFGLVGPYRTGYAEAARAIVESFGDMRRVGSAQATLSMVATGELDAAVSTAPLDVWDTLAGVHHVRSAGGTVTDAAGEPWHPGSAGLVASNGRVHDVLCSTVGVGNG
jgi:myo-inositol-1(or 4)-monophosphatase